MYIDHNILEQYPFSDGIFYKIGIDNTKPLDERVEEEIEIFSTAFDITTGSNLNTNTFTIIFPFYKEKDELIIKEGDLFKGSTYGMVQKGRVLGIYPSQLDGCSVLLTRI